MSHIVSHLMKKNKFLLESSWYFIGGKLERNSFDTKYMFLFITRHGEFQSSVNSFDTKYMFLFITKHGEFRSCVNSSDTK